MFRSVLYRCFLPIVALLCSTLPATTQNTIKPDLAAKIDGIAADALAKTGVPSASVAVVQDGRIVYLKAYGDARLEPRSAASPQMRYSVGSISKQFTATAILLLQEEGKLSLYLITGSAIPRNGPILR